MLVSFSKQPRMAFGDLKERRSTCVPASSGSRARSEKHQKKLTLAFPENYFPSRQSKGGEGESPTAG